MASSVLQMLLLEQPSVSTDCLSTESVFLVISHAYGLNCFPGMKNSEKLEGILCKTKVMLCLVS